MHFCRSWFSNVVSFRYVLVLIFFVFALYYEWQIFFNTIKFYTMSFLCNYNFFIDEKHTEAVAERCSVRKVFLEISQKFTGLRPQACNFIKKETLAQVFFSVNFVKFLRTPFLTEHLWWLLLHVRNECWMLKYNYFMKVFYVSWNDPETVFHEMLWKKIFSVSFL